MKVASNQPRGNFKIHFDASSNSFSEMIQDTTFVSTNMNVMQRYYIAGIDMYVGVTLLDQHRNVCGSSMRVHTVSIRREISRFLFCPILILVQQRWPTLIHKCSPSLLYYMGYIIP